MEQQLQQALDYAHKNHSRFLNSLSDFLSIPSISTSADHRQDMHKAAEWCKKELEQIGVQRAEIFNTPGHPVVYGEYIIKELTAPTILIYGHYDVQPPEPLELWDGDPFIARKVGDELFARGASDMKGQIIACFVAVETLIQQNNLPVNVKFLLEGEEEIGSPNLGAFLADRKQLLSCNVVLNPDTGMIAPDIPSITYGLRGLAYFEVTIFGPSQDLHSGSFGGLVHNPAQVLCELIAKMHDDKGRVTLPGFYDHVRSISPEEHAELARLPMDAEFFEQVTGVSELWGEEGFIPVERVGARPTLEVNGLYAGFTGSGSKTIIPAKAMAKISMRLVPDQDPHEVYRQLNQFMEENAPETVRWDIIPMAGGFPSMANPQHPATQALYRALQSVWNIRPMYKREGGSIPVVAEMQKILGVESILCGFGLPDDNTHSPNERLLISNWHRGIDALIHFFFNMKEITVNRDK